MLRVALLGLSALAISACETVPEDEAASDAQTVAAAAEKESSDPNRIICLDEPKTGTRIRTQRVCKTKREWDALAAKTQDDVQELRNNTGRTAEGAFSQ